MRKCVFGIPRNKASRMIDKFIACKITEMENTFRIINVKRLTLPNDMSGT